MNRPSGLNLLVFAALTLIVNVGGSEQSVINRLFGVFRVKCSSVSVTHGFVVQVGGGCRGERGQNVDNILGGSFLQN